MKPRDLIAPVFIWRIITTKLGRTAQCMCSVLAGNTQVNTLGIIAKTN